MLTNMNVPRKIGTTGSVTPSRQSALGHVSGTKPAHLLSAELVLAVLECRQPCSQWGVAAVVHATSLDHVHGSLLWSPFSKSVYLVMHWSDCNHKTRNHGFLQTIIVVYIFSSLAPLHSNAHIFMPSIILERTAGSRVQLCVDVARRRRYGQQQQ